MVSKSNNLPSRYRYSQRHPMLSVNAHVIHTGRELGRLVEAEAPEVNSKGFLRDFRRIAGVDLAWNAEVNASGVAVGRLTLRGLTIESVRGDIIGLDALKRTLDAYENLIGVAADAPLIIKNKTGSRPCEKALSRDYSPRWAGCYPSNLTRFPDAGSVMLSCWLEQRGFDHLKYGGKWQIEVYPHPAIVELLSLDRRLAYKKGGQQVQRAGQAKLTNLLRSLADSDRLPLLFDDTIAEFLTPGHVEALPAGRLKENEDMLDAIVCCYIGALFDLGMTRQTFGCRASGYIVVP